MSIDNTFKRIQSIAEHNHGTDEELEQIEHLIMQCKKEKYIKRKNDILYKAVRRNYLVLIHGFCIMILVVICMYFNK